MRKKLTINIDAEIYAGLHQTVGRRRISQFIEDLVRPHVTHSALEDSYRAMAQDEAREQEALDWAEATVGDATNVAR